MCFPPRRHSSAERQDTSLPWKLFSQWLFLTCLFSCDLTVTSCLHLVRFSGERRGFMIFSTRKILIKIQQQWLGCWKWKDCSVETSCVSSDGFVNLFLTILTVCDYLCGRGRKEPVPRWVWQRPEEPPPCWDPAATDTWTISPPALCLIQNSSLLWSQLFPQSPLDEGGFIHSLGDIDENKQWGFTNISSDVSKYSNSLDVFYVLFTYDSSIALENNFCHWTVILY